MVVIGSISRWKQVLITHLYLFLMAIRFSPPPGKSSPVLAENVVVKIVKRFTCGS